MELHDHCLQTALRIVSEHAKYVPNRAGQGEYELEINQRQYRGSRAELAYLLALDLEVKAEAGATRTEFVMITLGLVVYLLLGLIIFTR